MDTILVQAASLCEQGALHEHTPSVAFDCFRKALGLLLSKSEIMTSASPTLLRAIGSLMHAPQMYHGMLWTSNTSTLHRVSPCVYSRAFLLRPREVDYDCPLDLQIRIYIAMLFFNLATTIHTTCDSLSYPEYAMRVALELYDVGFDLLLDDEACSTDDCATNVSLAMLNNSADIHWRLSNYTKAYRVMELQKQLLEIMQTNMRDTGYSEKEIEVFIMNTQLLQAPSGAPAA